MLGIIIRIHAMTWDYNTPDRGKTNNLSFVENYSIKTNDQFIKCSVK